MKKCRQILQSKDEEESHWMHNTLNKCTPQWRCETASFADPKTSSAIEDSNDTCSKTYEVTCRDEWMFEDREEGSDS